MNWYEQTHMVNIGMVETGIHCIYEFETILNLQTGEITFCDHDDSDQPTPFKDVLEFFRSRGEEKEFYEQLNELIKK